jgi:ribose transport system permease protein
MSETTGGAIDPFSASEDVLGEELEAESGDEIQTGWRAYSARLITNRDLTILLVALALFSFFALVNPRFLSENTLIGIARRMPLIGVVAVGMTFVLVAGEIDLSVGSNYGFLVTVMAFMIVSRNVEPGLAMLLAILLGVVIGGINGLLVTRVRLPSFITTLGMLAVLRGAANLVSGGFPISADDTELPFYEIISGRFLDGRLPNLFIIMLGVMLTFGLILAKTKFGSDVYATGGSVEAARNNGINTNRVKLVCFMIVGGLCGLNAALLFGRLGIAPYNTGIGFELQVIAAAIVGGTGLFGGRGTIFGTLVGTFILSMLASGLILIGVQDFWEEFAIGVVILAVAGLDLVVRRSAVRLLARSAA